MSAELFQQIHYGRYINEIFYTLKSITANTEDIIQHTYFRINTMADILQQIYFKRYTTPDILHTIYYSRYTTEYISQSI